MAPPRTQHRVQVGDLAPPDRLVPSGIQSSTFQGAAPPPINNDLERLASALGGFSSALMAAGRRMEANAEKERKKAEAELQAKRDAEFLRWTLSTESDEQIRAYLAGEAPIDLVTDKLYKKYFGGLLGDHFANGIQEEIAAGNTAIGTEGFNPDAFLIEYSREYVKQLQGDEIGLSAFSSKFDAVGDEVREAHRKALSAERVANHKSIAKDLMRQAFQNAVLSGLEGEPLVDHYRKLYAEFGSRMENGAFNLNAREMDELTLDMLEEMAEDATYAEAAMKFLHVNRKDLANSELRIGSLAQIERHSDQVNRIQSKALKTLAKEHERQRTAQVHSDDLQRFKAQDGSFSTIQDFEEENPYDRDKPVKISQNERREKAVRAYLDEVRADRGGIDAVDEIAVLNANGVKHEEFFSLIESAVQAGVGSEMVPEQIARVVQAGTLYDAMPYSYVNAHKLSPKARDFFEMYQYGRRYMGLSPEESAIMVGRVQSLPEAEAKAQFNKAERAAIKSASQLTYGGTSILGLTTVGESTITNAPEVEEKIRRLATLYMRASQHDASTAIEKATERVMESTTIINGRAISGVVGLLPDDDKNAQPFLRKVYRELSDGYKEVMQIEKDTDLSLQPFGRDTLVVVRASDGQPIVNPETGAVSRVFVRDIQRIRNERLTKNAELTAKEVAQEHRPQAVHRRSLWDGRRPHEVIQKTFQRLTAPSADEGEGLDLHQLNPALPKRD